jgi:predicted nucleic acid-binding protein
LSCYYLDASALVKRYVDEAGSDWLRTIIVPARAPLLFTSRLTILEVTGAIVRRLREGAMTEQDLAAARDAFRGDCLSEYQIMPPTMTIIDLGCNLLGRHVLRAYDATHLATALSAQAFLTARGYPSLTFLSADEHFNRAASAEGLAVDNPNDHP